ncbi:iron ABC transporter permease [Natronomonas gomsonensis]|uniref:ABC transporter permease n=1 Tax=Natronomonas gomsonensis TaxID=1046043 RepID=UPI0020CA4FF6|nr:iron ABC transporter permease [Natronomonas gomsonensis]MCY4729588.1 iron ABC transporter permease [Natronomonas gomsonensis]
MARSRRRVDTPFLVAGLATAALLVVMLYYPVGSVLVEAVFADGRLTLAPIRDVLTDSLYFGDLAGVFAGESPADLLRVVLAGEASFGRFGFTAYQAVLSTLLSLAIGLPGAYVLANYDFLGRRTVRSLTLVPFVLPSIMVAAGFAAMFGSNGPLNRALAAVGLPTVELMFTLEIILLAHAFYNAPLVVRVVAAAWEGVDTRMVETARSLGASPRRAFLDVVVPQLAPAVLTSTLLVFIFTFMSFPIVLALGGFQLATVEVFLYDRISRLQLEEAAALAVLEAAITLGLTYAYLHYERAQAATRGVTARSRQRLFARLDLARLAIAGYGVVIAIVFVGPIVSMLLASVLDASGGFTLQYYEFLLDRRDAVVGTQPDVAIRNSLAFAVGTLVLAVPMGVVVALATARDTLTARVVGTFAMLPFAVSGVVVGLGLLQTVVFGVEVFGLQLQVTGAVAIVAAHAVGAYPFVVRTVTPALSSMDDRLVESARALGASRTRALLDIELPLVTPAVAAGAAFAFAISIGEFNSTVVLVEGGDAYTMPVAVQRYLSDRTLGPATAMGSVLLVVTSVSFVVIERLGAYGGIE